MSHINIGGRDYSKEEFEEEMHKLRREIRAQSERKVQSAAADLVKQLGHAYKPYTDFLKENPGVNVANDGAIDPQLFKKLQANLEQADEAPRCGYIKVNGVPCRSPRMKDGELCYAHTRMALVRPEKMDLPPLEDANSIQVGLMEVARGLTDGTMDQKTARLMLYCLQIASSNVARTTFATQQE
jgi:hypothetical protein